MPAMFSGSGRTNMGHGTATAYVDGCDRFCRVFVRATFRSFVRWCMSVSSCRRLLVCIRPPSVGIAVARCLCARRSLQKNHPRSPCSRSRRHWPWAVCVLFRARGARVWVRSQRAYGNGYEQEPQRCWDLRCIYALAIIPSIPIHVAFSSMCRFLYSQRV